MTIENKREFSDLLIDNIKDAGMNKSPFSEHLLSTLAANPDIINKKNPKVKMRPLNFACILASHTGNSDMVKILLNLGGNPLDGSPCVIDLLLTLASQNKYAYKIARECALSTNSLNHLAATYSFEKIEHIIEKSDVTDITNKNMEAMKNLAIHGMYAHKDAAYKTALLLITHGANPNGLLYGDNEVTTPFTYAVYFGARAQKSKIIKNLLLLGANPETGLVMLKAVKDEIRHKDPSQKKPEKTKILIYCSKIEDLLKNHN